MLESYHFALKRMIYIGLFASDVEDLNLQLRNRRTDLPNESTTSSKKKALYEANFTNLDHSVLTGLLANPCVKANPTQLAECARFSARAKKVDIDEINEIPPGNFLTNVFLPAKLKKHIAIFNDHF